MLPYQYLILSPEQGLSQWRCLDLAAAKDTRLAQSPHCTSSTPQPNRSIGALHRKAATLDIGITSISVMCEPADERVPDFGCGRST